MSEIGRNAPCPCGSDKKYKQCCGRIETDGMASSGLDPIMSRYNRAVSSQLHGDFANAIRGYRDVLERRPNFPEALSNLGLLLQAQGQLDEAIDCFRAALDVTPHAWTYNNLGNALEEMGQVDAAVGSYRRALALLDAPEIRINFARCVKNIDATRVDADLRTLLAKAIDDAWTRPADLAHAALKTIRGDPIIGPCVERASQASQRRISADALWSSTEWMALCNDALLLSLLQGAPICDIAMERFLTMARNAMLDRTLGSVDDGAADDGTIRFFCAIARQCHLNEYVFDCSDLEAERAQSLQSQIADALASDGDVQALWIIAAAAYAPLSAIPAGHRLLTRAWPPCVQALVSDQIMARDTETNIRQSLDSLTAIDDPVSLEVQRQYEESPYPRWTRVPLAMNPQPFNAYLRAQFPSGQFEPLQSDRHIDVLVAGCGTGQETIEIARQFMGACVLAVDLSAASLAYAKRKTLEASIDNVRYAQGDLLKLASTGKTFDVIASVGVLHHLARPLDGWSALLDCLRPGGFMRVGLYSEKARRDVVAARAFIAKRGYLATAADIRRARQDLIAERPDGFARVGLLRDFYTMSECRDLLFHVQEHRFTVIAIKQALATLGLRFIGFLLEPRVIGHYRTQFTDDRLLSDLSAWDALESQFPDTFTGMYRFWVQRPLKVT